MYLINQHTKKIMEECKIRARVAGLSFDDETLEYIVTNRDMIELSPKVMIPTLYDYWVNDVEILKGKGQYKLYPSNPYETVINSRPAISFYNDNNPDWLNVMIFYHVLGHIDFFQNNILFKNTWNDDFVGSSLADKRMIESLRSEQGRWVDYVIEFCRSIDNLAGFFENLSLSDKNAKRAPSKKIEFYFDIFLQEIEDVAEHNIFKEIARYNKLIEDNKKIGESLFFAEIKTKYPEFNSKFNKYSKKINKISNKNSTYSNEKVDVLEFIRDNSPFLNKEKNTWMKTVMNIIRNTSLYFNPQIRSKIINEGWASYWHDTLFGLDERIAGHEIGYAKINAGVTSISRVGLNPYAIGLRLVQYVEELANKGKLNFYFQKNKNLIFRKEYNKDLNKGKEAIFNLRENFNDFTLINTFVDQDFIDKHGLFVVGKRLNIQRQTYEYYVKSRKAKDYKKMLINSLYHPPSISVEVDKTNDKLLYLKHKFEDKQLYKDYIQDTMIGIEFLWGASVSLETVEIINKRDNNTGKLSYENRKVLYTISDKKLTKKNL